MPSRIGKQIISLPDVVTVKSENGLIQVQGPKGSITLVNQPGINIEQEDKILSVIIKDVDEPKSRAKQGLIRSLLANAVKGVSEGWEKKLEVIGVGFKVALNGEDLDFSLGFSHPIKVKPLPEVSFTVKGNTITINGIDKQQVGQMAENIRSLKKPEPYKGKGIRYQDEIIRKKAGKAAKAVGK